METTRNIDSIVMKEKGVKEKQKATRKTMSLEDSLDPSVANAGEGRLEVPKGKHRFRGAYGKIGEGSGDGV